MQGKVLDNDEYSAPHNSIELQMKPSNSTELPQMKPSNSEELPQTKSSNSEELQMKPSKREM